jgi:putative ubiquitin-RnfH superfamily antitoxin RatB of RatAB toxin-antitoxin module
MGPCNEKFYAVIVNAEVIEIFRNLIDHPKAAIRQEIVQALSSLMVH